MKRKERHVPFSISKNGFTLIELLLVIVLIGVFVGLVIPRVSVMFFDYEFHSTVEKVEKLIRYAQQSSLYEKSKYRLSLDRFEKHLVLEKEYPAEYGDKKEFRAVAGKFGEAVVLPEGCALSFRASDAIYFFPDGKTSKEVVTMRYKEEKEVAFTFDGTLHGFAVAYVK